MRHSFFLLFMVLCSLISCKKDKLKDDKEILTGKWNWTHSSHTYGWCQYDPLYEVITPDSISKTHSVEFLSKGKIKFFEDGTVQDKRRLVFDYFEQDSSGDYFFYLYLDNNKNEGMAGSLRNDTLHFDYPLTPADPECENYLNFFVRE
ncbi:hypothetical protein JYT74_00890 [Crocinitomix catalasitica]|nr:hypothetical protein [Crocinitomix catalasitica]